MSGNQNPVRVLNLHGKPQQQQVLGKGSYYEESGGGGTVDGSFMRFLQTHYLSFCAFICVLVTLFIGLFIVALLYVSSSTAHSGAYPTTLAHETTTTAKSVNQLFEAKPVPFQPPPPPSLMPVAEVLSKKSFDTVFRYQDGVPFDENNTSIRIYDLGTEISDMDMLSIMFFTCCCNDKSIVICDNRQTALTSSAVSALGSQPAASSTLADYSVNCYLSHDPKVPALNTPQFQYKHRWKLIVQFGAAFSGSKSHATDCVFSTLYYTVVRPTPPPPNPPPNEMAKKIW